MLLARRQSSLELGVLLGEDPFSGDAKDWGKSQILVINRVRVFSKRAAHTHPIVLRVPSGTENSENKELC